MSQNIPTDNSDFGFLFNQSTDYSQEYETRRQLLSPIIRERKQAQRKFISGLKKEALNALIPRLPDIDTDLWIVSNGSGAEVRHGINPLAFDFGSFIPHIVNMLGDKGCKAYVSTWTAARTHTLTMLDMLADGRLQALTFASDPYFSRREAAIYSEFVLGLAKYPGRARYLAWKNHCKVISIANHDDTRFCSITGSANLSSQPRTESYVLSTHPCVFQFFRDEFFEVMFNERA